MRWEGPAGAAGRYPSAAGAAGGAARGGRGPFKAGPAGGSGARPER